MSRINFILAIALLVIIAGCSKQEETENSSEPTTTSSGNPITAPVDYLGALAQAKNRTEVKLAIVSLDSAIRSFESQEERLPKDLDELIKKNYLPRLPKAPAHTQFDYDATTGKVELKAQK